MLSVQTCQIMVIMCQPLLHIQGCISVLENIHLKKWQVQSPKKKKKCLSLNTFLLSFRASISSQEPGLTHQ